jgi:hypothetical protein
VAPMITSMTKNISCSTFAEFLHLNFCILISFRTPVLHSYLMVLLHLSVSKFYLSSL